MFLRLKQSNLKRFRSSEYLLAGTSLSILLNRINQFAFLLSTYNSRLPSLNLPTFQKSN